MQIMEPLFVAIPGTYESQLMLPYGLQCHTARGGGGGAEHSDSGGQSSLPYRCVRPPSLNRKILKKWNKQKAWNWSFNLCQVLGTPQSGLKWWYKTFWTVDWKNKNKPLKFLAFLVVYLFVCFLLISHAVHFIFILHY